MLRLVVLVTLVGCGTSQTGSLHTHSLSQLPDPQQVMLGDDIVITGAASQCGHEWIDGKDDPKNIFMGLPTRQERCHGLDADIELSCSAPCAIHGTRVTPAQAGPLDVIATMRNGDRVLTATRTSYFVVTADAIGLACGTSERPASCGDIPASMAFVRPYVTVRGLRTTAAGVTLNGHPAKRYGATALADVFPEHAIDGHVEPGVYTLDVTLGDNHVRRDVIVR